MPTAEERYALAYYEAVKAEREALDPLTTWHPHPKQQAFLDAVLDAERWGYENWLCCANRFGKSQAGSYCGAMLARHGIEPLRPAVSAHTMVWDRATTGWIVGPDYQTLTQVLLPKYLDHPSIEVPPGAPHAPFIPAREVEYWNAADQMGKLKNGSLVRCKSNEQQRVRFAAAGVDWIHFDEEPLYRNYQEATLRVEAGRRLRIFGTCTLLPPEGKIGGVSWLYTEIIRPWLAGKKGINVFGGSIYDNPYLDAAEIARLEAKYPEGSPQRRIRLGGEYLPGIAGARAYGNFQRALHVRDLGAVDPRYPLCWCWDFNVAPFCTTVGQYHHEMFHIHQEFVLEEGNIGMMVEAFRERFPEWPHELWIYGDATSGARDVQTAQSDYDLIRHELVRYRCPGLKIKVPQANPRVKDRLNAVNQALRDANQFVGVVVDPSCIETIEDFEGVLQDDLGNIKKTHDRTDPYARRSHLTDGAGYWIWQVRPVRMPHVQTRRTGYVQGPPLPFGTRDRAVPPGSAVGNPFARSG